MFYLPERKDEKHSNPVLPLQIICQENNMGLEKLGEDRKLNTSLDTHIHLYSPTTLHSSPIQFRDQKQELFPDSSSLQTKGKFVFF